MFVFNMKLNFKKIIIITAVIIIAVALFFEIFNMVNSNSLNKFDYVLTNENFTEILKNVHNDIDGNIGKTIKVSGYIFRLPDFKEGYFVCGRDMLLYDEEKVVGFLSSYDGDVKLAESEWVEITGEFIKGYYQTDMPVIKVKTIKKITAPPNTFVETPDYL